MRSSAGTGRTLNGRNASYVGLVTKISEEEVEAPSLAVRWSYAGPSGVVADMLKAASEDGIW